MASSISTRDLLLLLLDAWAPNQPNGLGGITRLQKLLFLLEKEEGLSPTNRGFEFKPYKAGPYSSKLYDDLEFLENLALLESEVTNEATDEEASEMENELEEADADGLSFDDLISSDEQPKRSDPDAYEERRFRLTERGRDHVKALLGKGEYQPVVDKIRRVKSKYSNYSLNDLLYHVYTRYPEMTVESEIKDKVLGRSRGR
jgi:uncharacterized protein YwgA